MLAGGMHIEIEEGFIKETLEQLVLCVEAARKQPDCAKGYALPRTDDSNIVDEQKAEAVKDDTSMDETEDEVEEFGCHDVNTTHIGNTQLTLEEDIDLEKSVASGRTKRITGNNPGLITSPNYSEQTRTSFSQVDAAASLLFSASSSYLSYSSTQKKNDARMQYSRIEQGSRGLQP